MDVHREGNVRLQWTQTDTKVYPTDDWPTLTYISLEFGCIPSQVELKCTASDQAWGNEGHSYMRASLARSKQYAYNQWIAFCMASHHRLGLASPAQQLPEELFGLIFNYFKPWFGAFPFRPHSNTIFHRCLMTAGPKAMHPLETTTMILTAESDPDFFRVVAPGDIIRIDLASAPYPGHECRCTNASITYI
eukprot:c9557_g1_i1.p1 GENE.c9557_g1_i1~~c9557_g1_i1.p1  ORF type:complete len:191 (-),score=21.71 c9557_g1_i1:36-608(-)